MHQLDFEDDFLENFTSFHTREAYLNDLKQFFSWLKIQKGIDEVQKIERKDIVEFRNHLSLEKSQAPKTIARKLAAISSYFDFLAEKGQILSNPTHSVKRPRREVLHPTSALNKEQILEILEESKKNPHSGKMHFALLSTFFTTGLRKSEILKLKVFNYREINENKFLEFQGKGGKVGQKLLHPYCIEAINEYLDWSRSLDSEFNKDYWLFRPTKNPLNPSNLNKPLNPKTINEIFHHYGKKIGLNFSISPHSARASFISELLNIGIDIYSVAKEVRHSSVKTTEIYDKRRRQFIDSPILKLKL